MKLLFLTLFFLVSCATRTPVTDKLTRKSSGDLKHKISDVPVIAQKKNHCGPATLGMVLKFYGGKKSPDELSTNLFHKDLGGSFRSDVIASARREGMMVFEMDDMRKMFKEVKNGHPVIVFQNLGLESAPQWHFSVLRGYDVNGPDVYVNSGMPRMEKMDMRLFERSWILGGKWGALILPPDRLSVTKSDIEHVEAASLLEKAGNFKAALLAYQTILKKWPEQSLALIGAGNASYALKDIPLSERYFELAIIADPEAPIAFHNLSLIQSELGKTAPAQRNARMAIEMATPEQKIQFQKTLQHLLTPMSKR